MYILGNTTQAFENEIFNLYVMTWRNIYDEYSSMIIAICVPQNENSMGVEFFSVLFTNES